MPIEYKSDEIAKEVRAVVFPPEWYAAPFSPKDMKQTNPELKAPTAKPRWEYMDFGAISLAAEVMALNEEKHKHTNGGAEYSDGWKKIPRKRHFGSLMRHLSTYWMWTVSGGKVGEFFDPETGKPHLAHAFCRVMFLLGIEIADGGIK